MNIVKFIYCVIENMSHYSKDLPIPHYELNIIRLIQYDCVLSAELKPQKGVGGFGKS